MKTYQVNHLTAEQAGRAIDAAERIATAKGVDLSTAVVDAAGHLIAFRRMDGANLLTIANAQAKARAAAFARESTGKFQDLLEAGAIVLLAVDGLVAVRGGVPIVVDGIPVGAIACSGASGKVDEAAAQAGATAAGRSG